MRAVIDTCVMVSLLASKRSDSAPQRLMRKVKSGRIRAVISEKSLTELTNTLAQPRVRKRVTAEDAQLFLRALAEYGEMAPDVPTPVAITRDPKDDYLVTLARSQGAVIISSDRDLLHAELNPPALTPREALRLIPRQRTSSEALNQNRWVLRQLRLDGPVANAVTGRQAPTPPDASSSATRGPATLVQHRTVGVAPRSVNRQPGRTLTSFPAGRRR